MTNSPSLVGLVILPSSNELAWRNAIGAAARESGWIFTKPSSAALNERAKPTILLVSDLQSAPYDAVDVWAIIDSTPEQAVTQTLVRKPGPLSDVRRICAARFAMAATIIEQGGMLFDSGANVLNLPGLGRVQIMPSIETLASDGVDPLAFYETIPPVAGAKAQWPTEVFHYTLGQEPVGGAPEIDLTGRGRILVHGPYLDLSKGWWRITVRFAVEPEDVAYLRFDWGAGQDVTSYHSELDQAGEYQLVLDHLWKTVGPAELRIWAERGHFLGRMALRDCTVERLPDVEDFL